MNDQQSRRKFIKRSAIVGAGITILPNLTYGLTKQTNKEKLRVGLIGVGLRGTNHLNNLLLRDDVAIMAICDIDPVRIQIALDIIKEKKQPKAHSISER